MTVDRHPGYRTAVFAAGRSGRLLQRRRPTAFAAALAGAMALAVLSGAPAGAEPTPSRTSWMDAISAPPGTQVDVQPTEIFDNAGTNPRIMAASLSTRDASGRIPFYVWDVYEQASSPSLEGDGIRVKVKTEAQLNALPDPPPSTFYVQARVRVYNDEGETAVGTYFYRTEYNRNPTPATVLPPPPPPPPAIKQQLEPTDAPPGVVVRSNASDLFDNAGTNPRFTEATFSTADYYHAVSGVQHYGGLWVMARPDAELRALPSPPPSPFDVEVTVAMTNDEGETATGKWRYRTTYDTEGDDAEPPPPGNLKVSVPPDTLIVETVEELFDDLGAWTNPRFSAVTFSNPEYLNSSESGIFNGQLKLKVKTVKELNALSPPPPDPFEFKATVTMIEDGGVTFEFPLEYRTSYARTGQ